MSLTNIVCSFSNSSFGNSPMELSQNNASIDEAKKTMFMNILRSSRLCDVEPILIIFWKAKATSSKGFKIDYFSNSPPIMSGFEV